MSETRLELNEKTIPVIEELGRNLPGAFLIIRAGGDGSVLYANPALLNLFGCASEAEFRALTDFTFRKMLVPDDADQIIADYATIRASEQSGQQIREFRIIRRDGALRWVEAHTNYTGGDGIWYVFLSDITDKRSRMESDRAVRRAVIEALSEAYHTVWIINDVETETFSLYRGDIAGDTAHAAPIRAALGNMRYSQAKEYYINTTVAPSDRERLQRELTLASIVRQLENKPQFNINYLRLMDDGSERYFRIEFARLKMPGGRLGVVCGFKDVDDDVRHGQSVRRALEEGRRAEAENRRLTKEVEAAAKLTQMMGSIGSLLTNMPAMSFSKDAMSGKYLACNQSFAEYAHKASPDGVVGLTDHEIFDPVTAAHFVEDDQKALAMEEPYIFFEDVPDAVGNPRSFQTTKMKFTDGTGRLCTLGMCVDVTEMTRMKAEETAAKVRAQELEEKLRLQEALLNRERQGDQQAKMITALASDYWSIYYIELDRDHGVCYQAHSDIDGFRVGEEFPYLASVTDYAMRYISEPYRSEFLRFVQPDAIRTGLAKQRVISYRYLVHRHGRDSYEMVRFAGVRHPEDRDDHLVHNVGACFMDVDAETRRTLEQQEALSNALKAAEEANRAKTTFLSNMSHEIRTPMNAIIGLNNIALNDPETPEKTKGYLEKMGTSAQHLLGIINDILDMSRIESGRMSIKSEEFSFPKMLEQVNTMISGQCRSKGLHYECRLKGSIGEYYIGDDMKLRQVLINILGNAVKFTPEGGSVTFNVEETARFDGKTTLRFIVADTGIGMSREFLPKIFETFSQEDAAAAGKYGSTGLGMPITRSIVELMHGTIEVDSEKGVGSTFTVTLTLTDSARDLGGEELDELQGRDLCVLVIDDDPVACEHAGIVLGQVGIKSETAPSGAEGVEMVRMRFARREPYDLILVDWKMPGMDGLETTRAIRAIAGNDTPIIILTSYNWEDIVDEARIAGVDSFAPKPLFAATVMDEFRAAFRKKNANAVKRSADLAGRRILLAEDMPVNAEIMTMVLGMREMEVDLAENGRIALSLFERSAVGYYDAILMDMRMPEMDGLEATKRIRELDRPDAKTVPIIALTANAFDEDVQRSMQAGLNAHLSKPVEPENLYATLESLIPA